MSGLGSASISHSRCSSPSPSWREEGLRKKAGSMPPGNLIENTISYI